MGRTASNRRKKLNRRFLKCQQCGIPYDKSPEGLCYIADELDGSPDPKKCFCSDKCVSKWRSHHEIISKSHIRFFGTSAGYGIAVQNGDIVQKLPMQPIVWWAVDTK